MENKSLYVLAGYDDLTEKRLSEMQNRLYDLKFEGVQTKNIPMHFTLGSYDTDREEELIARLNRLSGNFEAFDVAFNHIGLFRLPENDVLFIAPEVSREMLSLKDEFTDNKDTFRWSAHTTLLIDKPDIIRKALPAVLADFSSFEGEVTRLYLYEFWPTRHILTVELKNESGKLS
ncbi:MAG: 2'-5' RNA ligase family protein [Clostridiales bacterium]|nr:2'-5' RNA ligase family protein [Clostridiales bacterium]